VDPNSCLPKTAWPPTWTYEACVHGIAVIINQHSYYCLTHLDTILYTIKELLTRFADGSKKGNNSQTLFAIDN
ncbi:MAG: hypothetical protein QN716_02725, partial [Nitrososphaeraceae archaeon]|nr:hypothetical protein [Nitrososphaeraceae archaeon]